MKSKYPIVLVHGIVIKDFKFIKAFSNIEKLLKEEGYSVYTSLTDGFGTIENNANQLKKQILTIMEKENTDKVNLIAHSKGGLDSKYMIESLGMEDHVASLTTLCTPHKGSIIATKLLNLPKWLISFIAFWINITYKIFKDENPDCISVAKQLKAKDSIENEIMSFSKKVYCQSYSTTMKKCKDDFIMSIPLYFSKKFEKKDSDGVVSKDSAKFVNFKNDCIDDESISHSEIIGFTTSKRKKAKIVAFYKNLCLDLIELGY